MVLQRLDTTPETPAALYQPGNDIFFSFQLRFVLTSPLPFVSTSGWILDLLVGSAALGRYSSGVK